METTGKGKGVELSTEQTRNFAVVSRLGLHALAATRIVQTATEFSAEVEVEKDGYQANGKNIIEMLMLLADEGSKITIRSKGEDAVQAMAAIEELILSGFGEAAAA